MLYKNEANDIFDEDLNPHLNIDPTIDARNHPVNKGRELLFDLEVNDLYLIEAVLAKEWATFKDTNVRLTFEDVLIREYRTDRPFSQLPVISFCKHFNSIRKKDGLEYSNFKEGETCFFIGKLLQYTSIKAPGTERRTIKLFRDPNLPKSIEDCESRIRRINSTLESIPVSDIPVRVNKTEKMIQRCEDILKDFLHIPWISDQDARTRITKMQIELLRLSKRAESVIQKEEKVLV